MKALFEMVLLAGDVVTASGGNTCGDNTQTEEEEI